MDLKLRIAIVDELDDELVHSVGMLDMASGDIHDVQYVDYDVATQGLPAEREDYAFTSGMLSHGNKDVEFSVIVERFSGKYSVSPNELLDIKVRAAKLFAGIVGKDLLGGGGSAGAGAGAPKAKGPRKKLH